MGGKTGNLNIMRKLRLQLKSGYIKKEPSSYLFMKRYLTLLYYYHYHRYHHCHNYYQVSSINERYCTH